MQEESQLQRQTPDSLMLFGFWYRALPSDKLSRGKLMKAMLLETQLALGRDHTGRAFALRDTCPHRGMPLSCGQLDGEQVECSYHGWRFDAHTGQCALIPSLVEKEDMPNAIALQSIQFNVARVIGPALGGIALTQLGETWCFGLNGLSFFAPIVSLLMLKTRFYPQKTSESILAGMKQGIGFIRSQSAMEALMVLAFCMTALGVPVSRYMSTRNKKSPRTPNRLEKKKYNPFLKRHTLHRETR